MHIVARGLKIELVGPHAAHVFDHGIGQRTVHGAAVVVAVDTRLDAHCLIRAFGGLAEVFAPHAVHRAEIHGGILPVVEIQRDQIVPDRAADVPDAEVAAVSADMQTVRKAVLKRDGAECRVHDVPALHGKRGAMHERGAGNVQPVGVVEEQHCRYAVKMGGIVCRIEHSGAAVARAGQMGIDEAAARQIDVVIAGNLLRVLRDVGAVHDVRIAKQHRLGGIRQGKRGIRRTLQIAARGDDHGPMKEIRLRRSGDKDVVVFPQSRLQRIRPGGYGARAMGNRDAESRVLQKGNRRRKCRGRSPQRPFHKQSPPPNIKFRHMYTLNICVCNIAMCQKVPEDRTGVYGSGSPAKEIAKPNVTAKRAAPECLKPNLT